MEAIRDKSGDSPEKTSPYNPQANPVERVMRELGKVLRAYASDDHKSWDQIIPRLETVINHLAHSSTNCTPMALEFDYRWYSPGRRVRIDPQERFQLPAKLFPLHQVPFRRRKAPDPETPRSREEVKLESRTNLRKSASKRKQQADKRGTSDGFSIDDYV